MRYHRILFSALLFIASSMPLLAGASSCCPQPITHTDSSCDSCSATQPIACSVDSCAVQSTCACPDAGRSFFAVRPLYQSVRPELISEFRNDLLQQAIERCGGALDVVVFGGQSTKSSNLGAYFMPFCQQQTRVTEQTFANKPALLAQHFNIFTNNETFESVFSISARQTAAGLGLHYKQAFCVNDEQTHWWYLDINMPVMHIKNEVSLYETIINDGGGVNAAVPGAVANMTQAFTQDAWHYGKIRNNCPMRKTGLADIEIKLGRQLIFCDEYFAAAYFGMLVPTGNTPSATRVFEPVIGHGNHTGLMWGGEGVIQCCTSNDEHWRVAVTANAHALYLFTKTQKRSFDLKNKPWSRYSELYADQAQATQAFQTMSVPLATPGINIFTQDAHVRPGFIVNGTTAIQIRCDRGFSSEIGYNLYARQQECVKLACDWQEGPALKAFRGNGDTNPSRTITNNEQLNDYQIINNDLANFSKSIITADTIDLQSAAHPFTFVQMVYGTLGYIWARHPQATFDASVGASYEFGDSFSAMHRWVVWGKSGVAF